MHRKCLLKIICNFCLLGHEKYKGFCYNGGTCYSLDTLSDRICHCDEWFAGPQCEFQRITEEICEYSVNLNIIWTGFKIEINCENTDMYIPEINPAKIYFNKKKNMNIQN